MSNESLYAMYVIGAVESNHNWAAINPTDAITLGMMQWWGPRAYNLMHRGMTDDKDGYATFKAADATLAAHVEANNIDWSQYFVTAVDVNAWQHWATRKENHTMQQNQWDEDFNSYQKVCDTVGIPAANIKQRIMFMTAYHQSPQRAYSVIGSVGSMASLERLRDGMLTDPILRAYPNRYNTAYDLLNKWDGKSAPPDFGQNTDNGNGGGGNTPPPSQPIPDKPVLVQQDGDHLIVKIGDDKYIAYKSTAQSWQSKTIAGQPIDPNSGGGGTPAPTPSDSATKILKWISDRKGKFAYSQGPARLNPDASGYTDCSGLIWSAYHFAIGKDIGTWTGAEAGHGTLICNSSNTTVADGIKKAQAADILLITWSGHNPSFDHEEIFQADTSRVWSHGGPGNGPADKSASEQMSYASEWEIRREL